MTERIYAFAPEMEAVLHVSPGETIRFEAQDALGGQIRTADDLLTELDFSQINPATGPAFVEGAEPGDTLVVKVKSVECAAQGCIITGPGMGGSRR